MEATAVLTDIRFGILAILLVASSAILDSCGREPPAAPEPAAPAKSEIRPGEITRETVDGLFAQMKEDGLDGDAELRWGFYFSDPSEIKLAAMSQRLQTMVETFQPSDSRQFWLHVEKVEQHTPDSLYQRNRELYRMAEEMGLNSYDGAEPGPLNPTDDRYEPDFPEL
jgi:hypothetical protein